MRVLIAPNAFKETFTAAEAAHHIRARMQRSLPYANFSECPIADGGDGFADVLASHLNALWIRRRVHNAALQRTAAQFALSADGTTAIIELARATGIAALKRKRPMTASTRGTGEIIAAALNLGARNILLGIGGSASTDGGTGLARALGARFLDRRGREVPEGGIGLERIAHIDLRRLHPAIAKAKINVACDVTNPLHGMRGAAHIFAPQKGASPPQVRRLDAGLENLARVIRRDLGINVQSLPGAGAAGGTGAGLAAFCGATLVPGFDLVAATLGLASQIQNCDVVVTGEGRLDRTSLHNKAPIGIQRLARHAGVPVVAVCGCVAPGTQLGFDAVFAASPPHPATLNSRRNRLALAGAAKAAAQWIRDRMLAPIAGPRNRKSIRPRE
ncbi:MAG TPA: glycerate kinase [Phycisphaerae bacterium]|nr:glycerate kinase [Phycisphaerae bacterium]